LDKILCLGFVHVIFSDRLLFSSFGVFVAPMWRLWRLCGSLGHTWYPFQLFLFVGKF
jgi:hypothetical protein